MLHSEVTKVKGHRTLTVSLQSSWMMARPRDGNIETRLQVQNPHPEIILLCFLLRSMTSPSRLHVPSVSNNSTTCSQSLSTKSIIRAVAKSHLHPRQTSRCRDKSSASSCLQRDTNSTSSRGTAQITEPGANTGLNSFLTRRLQDVCEAGPALTSAGSSFNPLKRLSGYVHVPETRKVSFSSLASSRWCSLCFFFPCSADG